MGTYTASFKSISGKQYLLEIKNDQITDGTLTLSADPLHLKSPEYDTKYPGLRSVELEINILTKSDLMELYTTEPLGTRVTLKENGTVIFYGVLEIDQYSMPCTPNTINEMQVVAIDILSALKSMRMDTRTAMYLYEWRNSFDTPLEDYHIRISWSLPFTRALISNDALMPTDLYADGIEEQYGTYGELFDEIGKAYNYTFMMVGSEVKCYNVDDVTTQATLGTTLSATLDIVKPYRYITAKFDKYPDIEQPAVFDKASPTGIAFPNATTYKRNKYKDKFAALWYAQSAAAKNWVTNGTMPEHSGISAVMGVNYADTLKDLSADQPGWMVGVSGVQDKKRPMVCNSDKTMTVTIEADIHINEQLSDSDDWDITPAVWRSTKPEGAYSGGAPTTPSSTIALMKYGTIIEPYAVTTDYWTNDDADNQQAWQHCTYGFSVSNLTDLQVVVRSPQATTSSGRGYRFAKNIKIHYTFDEDITKKVVASYSDNEDYEIDNKLNTLYSQSHGYTTAPLSEMGGLNGKYNTLGRMNALASQYSKPRRKYTITHTGTVDAMAKVTFGGKIYTQLSFDRDLLNEQQTTTILESWENDDAD